MIARSGRLKGVELSAMLRFNRIERHGNPTGMRNLRITEDEEVSKRNPKT